jgi:hypothetical protein
MSYVEIILQVRDDETHAIHEHLHYHVTTPLPRNFITARALELSYFCQKQHLPLTAADGRKPCSLCYTLPKEKPRAHHRSQKPKNR